MKIACFYDFLRKNHFLQSKGELQQPPLGKYVREKHLGEQGLIKELRISQEQPRSILLI